MHDHIKALFVKHKIKHTHARLAIVEVLKEAKAPLNYEQIKAKMNLAMDKATFYRNIAMFEASGMIHKFESDDRKWYFELSSTTHAHFICDACHQIKCIEINMDTIEGDVKSIVLKGTCKECKA
ncbi:MAG: transcriptional repressor [Sulfurospirillaceae bacterium]|nr:transcriptional repressor [Sulfurospirillaceae bacterium]MDD2825438.1 transcriptional repressor [Sulfurospirillaceae bacterium]